MPLQEVEVLLGGPAGAYTSDGKDWSMRMFQNGLIQLGHTRRIWVGDRGGIRIDFDEQERVASRQWCPRGASFWDRIRAWFHAG
jgi:hypothetical protein